MTTTMTRRVAAAAATLATLATALLGRPALACPNCDSEFKPGTYTGEARRIGNGVAYSWVTLGEKGKPTAIGVTLTETALEGLPADPPKDVKDMARDMFSLMLPKQAMKTAFDHISLDWVARGHEPMGVYDKPHFDIHFYTLGMEARQKITAAGADIATCRKPVPAGFSPAGYVYATGTEVPMMGGHWINPKAPELNGQPFTKTFLYGSYDGKMVFFEPMITRAYLETKPDFSEAISLPSACVKSAYYPRRYTVRHDPVRREYTVALEAMTWRESAARESAARQSAARQSAANPAPSARPAAQRASRKMAPGKVVAGRPGARRG